MDARKLANAESGAGQSLLEKLWEELDSIMDRLMEEDQPDSDSSRQDVIHYGELRGQAQGVAYAIAIIEQPYKPDMPGVKDRAMERWEERNADD